MSILTFVIIMVVLSAVIGPLAKGLGRRIGKSGAEPAELKRLQTLLEETEQRVQDAERRLQLAEDRLDFQEKLLSSRASHRESS